MTDATDAFRDEVEKFLVRYAMAPSLLGSRAVGDPNFVLDLRQGRSPTLRIHERVTAFMRQFSRNVDRAEAALAAAKRGKTVLRGPDGEPRLARYQPGRKRSR